MESGPPAVFSARRPPRRFGVCGPGAADSESAALAIIFFSGTLSTYVTKTKTISRGTREGKRKESIPGLVGGLLLRRLLAVAR